MTLDTSSTTAIGVRVYHAHQEDTNPEYRSSKTYRFLKAAILHIFVIVLIGDIAHAIYVSFYAELISNQLLAAFYTAVQVPASAFFILFASITSRHLMAGS